MPNVKAQIALAKMSTFEQVKANNQERLRLTILETQSLQAQNVEPSAELLGRVKELHDRVFGDSDLNALVPKPAGPIYETTNPRGPIRDFLFRVFS